MKKSTFAYMMAGAMALNILGAVPSFADGLNTPNTTNYQHVQTAVTTVAKQVTLDQAKTIALRCQQGNVKSVEMKKENGTDLYSIRIFGQDGRDHDVKIDQKSGKVLRVEAPVQVTPVTQEQAKWIALQQEKGTIKLVETKKESGADQFAIHILGQDQKEHIVRIDPKTGRVINNQFLQQDRLITSEQVKEIALRQHKGTVKAVEMKKENGSDLYNVHILDANGKQWNVKCDAHNGKVVKVESLDPQKRFSQEEAKEIAMRHFKGSVKNVEIKKENGIDLYSVHIHGEDGKDHEVKVDVNTGNIR